MNPCPRCGQAFPGGLHGWTVTATGRVWHCPSEIGAPLCAENIADPPEDRMNASELDQALAAAHPDWHICCEPTPEMLAAGYIDADGERQDLTPGEMRSVWFRMHAAIRRDA